MNMTFKKYTFCLLIIKPTRCTNFTNLFLEWNSICSGQFLCPSSGVFHCTRNRGVCHTILLTSCSQAVGKLAWHILLLCLQWKTPDDGQRNCPKHVQLYSKNKFEKLVYLFGFIIRIYHDARSPKSQIHFAVLYRKSCLYDDTHILVVFLWAFWLVWHNWYAAVVDRAIWHTFGIMISRGRLMYRAGKVFCLFIHQNSHSWTTGLALVGWETHV